MIVRVNDKCIFPLNIMITGRVIRLPPQYFVARIESFRYLRNKYKTVEQKYGEEFDNLTEQYYNTQDEDHDHRREDSYDEEKYLREYIRIGKRMSEILDIIEHEYDSSDEGDDDNGDSDDVIDSEYLDYADEGNDINSNPTNEHVYSHDSSNIIEHTHDMFIPYFRPGNYYSASNHTTIPSVFD